MRNRADIWPRRVDARVDPQLGIRLAFAFELLAVDVEHEQAIGVREGRAGSGWKEERARARDAGADVSECGHQARGVHDPVGEGHIVAKLGMRGHISWPEG